MSSPDEVKRIRLPAACAGWEAKLDLKSLVSDGGWDHEPRFAAIDSVRIAWRAAGLHDLADDPESLVQTIWPIFVQDDQMREYVLHERNLDITSASDWQSVAETYAYVVLQRYNRDMRST